MTILADIEIPFQLLQPSVTMGYHNKLNRSTKQMVQRIIMAVGPDRPGIVGELTSWLHAGGANLLSTRMVNLRGQFAMLILLEAPEEFITRSNQEISRLASQMNLRIEVLNQSERAPAQGLSYQLKTYSLDQPGIVARFTQALQRRGINIEELSARQQAAPFAGGMVFLTDMRLSIPVNVPLGQLRAELDQIANELNCDVDLDPA